MSRDGPKMPRHGVAKHKTSKTSSSSSRRPKPTSVVKPSISRHRRKNAASTSTRNHSYESFTSRILRLNSLASIHYSSSRVLPSASSTDNNPGDGSLHTIASSTFATALEEWSDRNLSTHFTAFLTSVSPLCESLPMVLHNENRIWEILLESLQSEGITKDSAEPLLSLVGDLARDVGMDRLEVRFGKVWSVTADVVAKTDIVEVVEWGMGALAGLAKIGGKILLRNNKAESVDDEMKKSMAEIWWRGVGKWLGRERQKPFVVRYIGEVVGYLLRRAAKDEITLRRALKWLLNDFIESQEKDWGRVYEDGIKVALSEAVKGLRGGVHSVGVTVFTEVLLLAAPADQSQQTKLLDLVQGALISVLHHTDTEGFEPVETILLDFVEALDMHRDQNKIIAAELLRVLVTTRKGSRITDWNRLIKQGVLMSKCQDTILDTEAATISRALIIGLSASVLCTAPINVAHSHASLVLNFKDGLWKDHFLSFCYYMAELSLDRFRALVLDYFKQFVIDNWLVMAQSLAIIIPRLHDLQALIVTDKVIPHQWYKDILKQFNSLDADSAPFDIFAAYLRLLKSSHDMDNKDAAQIAEKIWDMLDSDSENRYKNAEPRVDFHRFLYGDALAFATSISSPSQTQFQQVMAAASHQSENLSYVESATTCIANLISAGKDLKGADLHEFQLVLIENLGNTSHDMRSAAIKGLQSMSKMQDEIWTEMLEVISSIEDTPPSVQTVRFISAQIRRFTVLYKSTLDDEILCKVIPTYCFGLLHLRLTQAWDDAIQVLKVLVANEKIEGVVVDIVKTWLEGGEEIEPNAELAWSPFQPELTSSDFECTEVSRTQALLKNARYACENIQGKIEQVFRASARICPAATSFNRTQSLLVLKSLPQMAEKRSRLLVPVLLQWARIEVTESADESDSKGNPTQWSRKDQKAMLAVFAQFQNPKVLYRATEAYNAILNLLTNGDGEIQKSALLAILTWKAPEVVRYRDHLLNFLDDSRFREEVSLFLRVDMEDGIRPEDLNELSPVLLRLLYGLIINRTGNASGARGKKVKRKAIFAALVNFPAVILEQFVDIAIKQIETVTVTATHPRKLIGVLNVINNMLDTLGGDLEPFAKRFGNLALSSLLLTQTARLDTSDDFGGFDDDVDEAHADEAHADDEKVDQVSLFKPIRQAGYKCLVQLFTYVPHIDWKDHAVEIVEKLVSPRFDKFVAEYAQAVSGILRLFSTWSISADNAKYLIILHERVVPSLADCLIATICPVNVKIFILERILVPLFSHTSIADDTAMQTGTHDEGSFKNGLCKSAPSVLQSISGLINQDPPKHLLDVALPCVFALATWLRSGVDAAYFIQIAAPCLRQPDRKIPIPTKLNLLRAMDGLLPLIIDEGEINQDTVSSIYEALAGLFKNIMGREPRQILCDLMSRLSVANPENAVVSDLCQSLNAYDNSKLDEPDYERRSQAFVRLNELTSTLTSLQWQPILNNLLYFIRDDDLGIRTSASLSLQKFIQSAAQRIDDKEFAEEERAFTNIIQNTVLVGVREGMRNPSELARTEYLAVMAQLIKYVTSLPEVQDMLPLLADNDEEASFFTNILHVQQHRRQRALRRLADEAAKSSLSSNNVATIFFPLLEHFVLDAANDEGAHNLTHESIVTLGKLTQCLAWSQLRAILKRYIGLIKIMEGKEKTVIRLIGAVVDGLCSAKHVNGSTSDNSTVLMNIDDTMSRQSTLAASIPAQSNLASTISDQLLPPLLNFIHMKDESTVSVRVPVVVTIVKLLTCSSEAAMTTKLPGVLLHLCYILRSRDQTARDMTRRTLAEITSLLGPRYFQFVIKELKTSLQRGYQLHVLSYTIHSILVENLAKLVPGDIDHCINDLMTVIMDDIFGVVGQEKDAEEYISKMKEVKSSKSFDSMELLASLTTLGHLGHLIKPIRTLLMEKLDHRTVQKIDELLRRFALGIAANKSVANRDVLMFCYEIVQEVNSVTQRTTRSFNKRDDDWKTRKYVMHMQAANKTGKRGATSSYLFKMSRFAFDLLRSILHKHDDLMTPENLAGFVPLIDETFVSDQEEVQLSVMRLLTTIMRVSIPKLESNASTYVAEAVKIIKAAPSMTIESAQAALKLISVTLRDKSSTRIREVDLAYALKRLRPDLEQPDRQGVIFNFLKAVLARKIVVTEVYEVMDTVASIMVTNQTRSARDLARGLYCQFMMDYPQAKERLKKQIAFLIQNLDYKYPEGRQSVLELLHLLVQKTHGDVKYEIHSSIFVPLVMLLVNDDNTECREMAGVLLKQVLDKADKDTTLRDYLDLLRQWLTQQDQILLRRASLQIWKMHVETGRASTSDIDLLIKNISSLLPTEEIQVDQDDWELLYYALQLFAQIGQMNASLAFGPKCEKTWRRTFRCLSFPHAWIKLSAARLIGVLFAEIGKTSKESGSGLGTVPLKTSGSVSLESDDLRQICAMSLRVLRYEGSSEALLAQTARNLVFLGRCFSENGLEWKAKGWTPDTNVSTDGQVLSNDQDGASSNEDDEDKDDSTSKSVPAIQHLLIMLLNPIRTSTSLTSANPASIPPKLSCLQVMHTLLNILPLEIFSTLLPRLLHPLMILTDPSVPKPTSINPAFTEPFSALIALAQETLDKVREKVGGEEWSKIVRQVQSGMREKREERRVKRRIDRVATTTGQDGYNNDLGQKRRKMERKVERRTERRKEKGREFVGRRKGY